jgi:ribosomal-protein-alanine N-acetyltransferase
MATIERDSFESPWSDVIFRQELASPISNLLVVRMQKDELRSVVGYIVYWIVIDEFHLHRVAIRRDQRGRGIATMLMKLALSHSLEKGANRATLEVRRSNLPALGLYRKFGFSVKGVRTKYYEDTGEDALVMWADLQAGFMINADSAPKVEDSDG